MSKRAAIIAIIDEFTGNMLFTALLTNPISKTDKGLLSSSWLKKEDEMGRSNAQRKPVADVKIDEILGPGPKPTKYIPEGFQRKNFVMQRDQIYKLKCLSYWDNTPEYIVL